MILSLAKVQDASAQVIIGDVRMTFHRISDTISGSLPTYRYDVPEGCDPLPQRPHPRWWKPEDDLFVLNMRRYGVGLKEISVLLNRSVAAVKDRKRANRRKRK